MQWRIVPSKYGLNSFSTYCAVAKALLVSPVAMERAPFLSWLMHATTWIRYLLGQGPAIQEVVVNRNAVWTGLGLVLLTSIARNYDQTFIGEKPLLWLFGALMFSFVSGAWLYAVIYGCFARWRMDALAEDRPRFWSGFRSFMGLFWMTAPVAWLYAIPVERFLEPVAAAWANVLLLSVVSLWRVLLMTRVLQHLCGTPFLIAGCWVLFAAAVEVLVVFFLGGGLARAIIRGMGGMRNSPAEEVLYASMSSAFVGAMWIAPCALVLALGLRPRQPSHPLPKAVSQSFAPKSLLVASVAWLLIAILPQVQLTRNLTVERLMAEGQARPALDYLNRHQVGHFAPARTLSPKPFEYSIFTELPQCLAVVQPSDADWVRRFLVRRLEETMVHYRLKRWGTETPEDLEAETDNIADALAWRGPDAGGLDRMLAGLQRIPEGQSWLVRNRSFLLGAKRAVEQGSLRQRDRNDAEVATDVLSLSNRLEQLLADGPANSRTNSAGESLVQ